MTSTSEFIRLPSSSKKGKWYRVYLCGVCECKGYAYTQKCRHVDEMRRLTAKELGPFINEKGTLPRWDGAKALGSAK
jgi:hypothetical protein